jgi:hypothetical protein
MAELVANCPRCKATAITFDVTAVTPVGVKYNWKYYFEAFAICRRCARSTTFLLEQRDPDDKKTFRDVSSVLKVQGALNKYFQAERYISLKDQGAAAPPEHVPEDIAKVFREGATSLVVECWNAAGTMFRVCVDLATRPMLPDGEALGLTKKVRRDLGLRLPWLFDNGKLPADLRELSSAVREDGNDGAHEGTLTKVEAEDLLDFTTALLGRIFTEPMRLQIAKERRAKRRSPEA